MAPGRQRWTRQDARARQESASLPSMAMRPAGRRSVAFMGRMDRGPGMQERHASRKRARKETRTAARRHRDPDRREGLRPPELTRTRPIGV